MSDQAGTSAEREAGAARADLANGPARAMRLTPTLVIVQAIGIGTAVLVATLEIESIVYSGPILSATGLALAVFGFRTNRPWSFWFGLASPSASVGCFALIYGMQWGPQAAQRPVSLLLIGFAMGCLALAWPTLVEARRANAGAKLRFQFTIAAMLGVTLVLAMLLGILRVAGPEGAALAILAAYLILVGYFVAGFQAERNAQPAQPPSASPPPESA